MLSRFALPFFRKSMSDTVRYAPMKFVNKTKPLTETNHLPGDNIPHMSLKEAEKILNAAERRYFDEMENRGVEDAIECQQRRRSP